MVCGTLYQLRKLINRRNVVTDPSKSVAPCEEFFLLVVETHILAAAMNFFKITSLDDNPCSTLFPKKSVDLCSLQRRQILMVALRKMTKQYVDLNVTYATNQRVRLSQRLMAFMHMHVK